MCRRWRGSAGGSVTSVVVGRDVPPLSPGAGRPRVVMFRWEHLRPRSRHSSTSAGSRRAEATPPPRLGPVLHHRGGFSIGLAPEAAVLPWNVTHVTYCPVGPLTPRRITSVTCGEGQDPTSRYMLTGPPRRGQEPGSGQFRSLRGPRRSRVARLTFDRPDRGAATTHPTGGHPLRGVRRNPELNPGP